MVDRSKQTKYERDDHPTQTGNIWPPPPSPDETDSEKTRRVAKEMEAKRVSDTIEQAIDLERAERRKRQADTKILLLGRLFNYALLWSLLEMTSMSRASRVRKIYHTQEFSIGVCPQIVRRRS